MNVVELIEKLNDHLEGWKTGCITVEELSDKTDYFLYNYLRNRKLEEVDKLFSEEEVSDE